MKKRSVLTLVLGVSVLVAVVWGCGDDGARHVGDAMVEAGTTLRDATADARAQGACARWEVSSIPAPNPGNPVLEVPAGWEPFAADAEYLVYTRRCAQ